MGTWLVRIASTEFTADIIGKLCPDTHFIYEL